MLNFQSSGIGLSLIQIQSHIPPRLTSFSSGPSIFRLPDQELAAHNPEDSPEDYPGSTGQVAARTPVDRPVDNPVDLNSSNSHIYNVKLALVELSRQICSPNGAPGSSDLGVSIYKSQIADHKSQIAN